MLLSGAFSYPVDRNGFRDYSGTEKISFGLGSPSFGYSFGRTSRF